MMMVSAALAVIFGVLALLEAAGAVIEYDGYNSGAFTNRLASSMSYTACCLICYFFAVVMKGAL